MQRETPVCEAAARYNENGPPFLHDFVNSFVLTIYIKEQGSPQNCETLPENVLQISSSNSFFIRDNFICATAPSTTYFDFYAI